VPSPFLVACLVQLRAEFNEISPSRDKGADGWIGDAAHQSSTSDHNPDSQGRVLALDIDSSGPWTDASFDDFVQWVVRRQDSGADSRLEYVIWNRRIASRSSGWSWQTYTGTADPHTNHAHFSARHDHTGNTSSAPWYLEEAMLTDATIDRIADATAVASRDKILTANLGASGPTVGQALQNGISDSTVTKLLGRGLGSSGVPTVGQALQTGAYGNTNSLLTRTADLLDKAADLLAGQAATDAAVAALKSDIADLRASLTPPANG
jgi:hypothetical protein